VHVRILILNWKDLAHPLAGGAEVFTEEVARSLVARGHRVTLFAAGVHGKPSTEAVEGVEVIRRGGRLTVYRAAKEFWVERGRESFDVVVDEINTRPFLTPRWIDGTPIVALIYQLAREIWKYETPFPVSVVGRYLLEPWWLRAYRTTPALTVSTSSADSLTRLHGWRDVAVVPLGYTPHRTPAVPKEAAPTVVFLGRLVPMKRPEHALEAFRLVKQEVPSARLWVVGEGPLLPRLRGAALPGVTFFGRVGTDELRSRLARAHVLVATSVREGWGLNVSEAAACGTPSVGYRVPGLVDSVAASGGAIVDPSPRALADALAAVLAGRLRLKPRLSTVPWADVAAAVEKRLMKAVEAHRHHASAEMSA
jgi:glycosyltransferase involved in cell wall biosynthesis